MSEPFLGSIGIFGFNFAPRSWAMCDGQLLPINQNQALFSLLGTYYGGDGRTTFGLPDLRGRAAMHTGNGPGLTTRHQGSRSGSESVTLDNNNLPSHTHTARGSSGAGTSPSPVSNYPAKNANGIPEYGPNPDVNMKNTSNSGGSQSHDNMQPFLAINFCICLSGLYPSRS